MNMMLALEGANGPTKKERLDFILKHKLDKGCANKLRTIPPEMQDELRRFVGLTRRHQIRPELGEASLARKRL